ncbi:MAG: GNAT family N-acetyltransferase [Lachnospiraceae bacterium]|nr:GNAT family N-acetyltransferase [Lachnospiraceae bacterium]
MIHRSFKPSEDQRRSFETLWNSEASLPPLSEWLDDENAPLCLYENDPLSGQCIGLCLVQDAYEDPWIILLVAKDHRRKKIATRLLEAAKKAVSAPALYYMSNAKETPETLAFLKSGGFEIFSRECIMKLSRDMLSPEETVPDENVLSIGNTHPHENTLASVTLRPCTTKDFRPIYKACFDLPYQPDEGNYFQILSEDQTTVGGVALTAYKSGWFLFDLCILPKYRKKGYAQAAVAAAFREALEDGTLPDSILLHVSSLNAPAFSLYEKMGFAPVEERVLYELKI